MSKTSDLLMERRLERMRLGQAVCETVTLQSDEEVKIALVPLTEAEYEQSLSAAASRNVPDNIAGAMLRDRTNVQHMIRFSAREVGNLENHVWETVDEMMEMLSEGDLDQLIDEYNEMTAKINPQLDGIPNEEFETLKKVLSEIQWSGLSGKSWYAAKRFLGALIQDGLLSDNTLGSLSTKNLTTTSE